MLEITLEMILRFCSAKWQNVLFETFSLRRLAAKECHELQDENPKEKLMKTQEKNSVFAHSLEILKRIGFNNYWLKLQTQNLAHGSEITLMTQLITHNLAHGLETILMAQLKTHNLAHD